MSADIVAFDPVAILGAKLDALAARVDRAPAAQDADELSRRAVEIEDRIAGMAPRSAAGAAVQLRLLRQWGDFDWQSRPVYIQRGLVSAT